MGEQMNFPNTFKEFAEQYKTVDTKEIYSNGIEYIPIFRVEQWLEYISAVEMATFKSVIDSLEQQLKTAKAEAYKEFAELLHCQCESIINQPHNENVRPISWKVAYEEFDEKIDNLLKELEGDNGQSRPPVPTSEKGGKDK